MWLLASAVSMVSSVRGNAELLRFAEPTRIDSDLPNNAMVTVGYPVSLVVTGTAVVAAGPLELTKAVAAPTRQGPGAELTYTTVYRNVGTDLITAVTILEAVPAFTQFKVGSATTGTPPASITGVTMEYSNDGGTTWTYVPRNGGGGAPDNFDANVTNIRFVLEGSLPPGAASAIGVGFTVRIMAE